MISPFHKGRIMLSELLLGTESFISICLTMLFSEALNVNFTCATKYMWLFVNVNRKLQLTSAHSNNLLESFREIKHIFKQTNILLDTIKSLHEFVGWNTGI